MIIVARCCRTVAFGDSAQDRQGGFAAARVRATAPAAAGQTPDQIHHLTQERNRLPNFQQVQQLDAELLRLLRETWQPLKQVGHGMDPMLLEPRQPSRALGVHATGTAALVVGEPGEESREQGRQLVGELGSQSRKWVGVMNRNERQSDTC